MALNSSLNEKELLKFAFLENQKRVKDIKKNKKWGFDKDWETFIYGLSLMNPQTYGLRIQNRIIAQFGMQKVKASENQGDFKDNAGEKYECKTSLVMDEDSKFHVVQVRPWQNSNYYCVMFDIRDEFKCYAFMLTAEEMKKEIYVMGASAAHGTSSANQKNRNIEYRFSITPSMEDRHFKRWVDNYRIDFDLEATIDLNELLELERKQALEEKLAKKISEQDVRKNKFK